LEERAGERRPFNAAPANSMVVGKGEGRRSCGNEPLSPLCLAGEGAFIVADGCGAEMRPSRS